jgi:uncharacterized protein YciI
MTAADAHTAALDFQRKLTELTGKMLRKKLFMVTFTSKVGMDELFPVLPAHLEYMIALARKGVLFAAGPVNAETGAPTGGGMALLNTATADDARHSDLQASDRRRPQGTRLSALLTCRIRKDRRDGCEVARRCR